ncbi:pyridoxamine 5'-phosphate oxidase family protein [Granulicoccus phenolivorans]|uniref:pyridoxamine 5'-phosphate oxidase family protein n=1 Tax=Granulicoccus phenolivorans TaxID=266854 RepID=UPI00042315D5|nr:pyridoxamine 5'-phosphate oxidase family protein [Granulicoccus phenolivorans]
MPKGLPPQDALDFLKRPNPAVMATVNRAGQPVSVATWYLLQDDNRILLDLDAGRARLKHLRSNGLVSLTALDHDNWGTHLSVRGHVVEIADEPGLAGIDLLAIHYTGKPYAVRDRPRVSVWFAIDSYHGWGALAGI